MPEYRFSNPHLEDIHNSIVRMHKQVDYLFYLFSIMLEILNRRDDMQSKENKNSVGIDQKKLEESVSYDHPISLKNFGELDNPVLDSEGYFREKGEPSINLGIYSRKPVTITESSDIKKVQNDYKSLQGKVDNLTILAEKMMKKLDDYDVKWAEREEQWKKEEAARQQEDVKRHQQDLKWEEQKKEWATENKAFQEEKRLLLWQIDDKDKQLREQKSKNEKLTNENFRLVQELDEKNEIINHIKSDDAPSVRKPPLAGNNIISDDDDLEPVELKPWKEYRILPADAKGRPRDTYLGFKHTVFDAYFPREKKENEVRICAYEGNNERLTRLLNQDNSLANGRGMPDSLGSTVKSWQDKTPLMLASQEGHVNCVQTLLEHGANPNYLDRDNLTALDYAQQRWNKRIANILRENDAMNGIDLIDKVHDFQESQLVINTVR